MKFFYVLIAFSILKAVVAENPPVPEPVEPSCLLAKFEDINATIAHSAEANDLCKCINSAVDGSINCDDYKNLTSSENNKLHAKLRSVCDHFIMPISEVLNANNSVPCNCTSKPCATTNLNPVLHETVNDTSDSGNKTITDKSGTDCGNNASTDKAGREKDVKPNCPDSTKNATSNNDTVTTRPAATNENITRTTLNATSTTTKKPELSTVPPAVTPAPLKDDRYPLSSILWSVFGSLIAGFLLAVVVKMLHSRFRKRSYGTGHGA